MSKVICELLQVKWNLVLSTRPFALKGQLGKFVVIIDCVVVGVDVVLVVVFVVAAVVVDVVVVVVAVVVVFAVVCGVVVVLVVVIVVVEWDVGGSLDVVDDVPDVVSGSDVVVHPESHITHLF